MRVLVLGGGAREHAIAATLHRAGAAIYNVAANANPGIERIAQATRRADPTRSDEVVEFARAQRTEYAVIGPEAPLAAGVADALRSADIPVVGPSQSAARIESSKAFTRALLTKYRIEASPKFVVVTRPEELAAGTAKFSGPFVVKPAGLTAGKGVWVQGADFETPAQGAAYAAGLLSSGGGPVVLEEKLEGEEFSLMAFVTDSGLYPMPAVQDYKRAQEGDQGSNTGGMGSYSQRDHLLPFLSRENYDRAFGVMQRTVQALQKEGIPYRGILYGGFMQTSRGPLLLEFNARFGDPEGINVLALYEDGDFAKLLWGVAVGHVDPNLVRFRLRATVVKYVVPPGYGGAIRAGGIVTIDEPAIEADGVHVIYGSVEAVGGSHVRFSTSRGIALVGEASAIHEAGTRVEAALSKVRGEYYVRHDIATKADLTNRVEHMRQLLAPAAKPSPLPLSVLPAGAPPSSAGSAEQLI
ncbi:MAG: phosphoribosylamine--glycine ligase [Thermoplasmata archaeon]